MKTLLVAVAACLSGIWGSMIPKMPAGKCRDPMPDYPGLNVSQIQDIDFFYVYAPDVLIYKMADTVKMNLKRMEGEDGVFLESIKALSVFKTPLNMQFKVKDLGNGVLKKITKEGEMSYYASIVAIQGDLALVYVCSNEAKDVKIDFRYVVAPKGANPGTIQDPHVLFKDANEKFNFIGELRELPRKWMEKVNL